MSYRRKVKRRINKKKMFLKVVPSIILLLVISFFIIQNRNNVSVHEQKIERMQQFDDQLSISDDTAIKTYYVSADGTSKDGTDINNPMSLKEANNKTYHGNEKLLFKCGDTFYGTINFNVEASEDEMFYIGSYGEGEKPIISGANILINRDAWELDEEGIYKLDLSNYSNFEGIGKTYWEPYNIGFVADEQGNIYGNRKKSKDKLENQNDFYCESKYLYIKSDENPTDKLGKIKITSRNDLVKLSSNTILEGLDIQYTGAHAISKKSDTIENVYIHDCIIQNIGGSVQVASSFTRYGNGIEFWSQAENTLVENCIIRNIYDAGYTVQGNTTNTGFTNNICRNNIFINCTYDIEMASYNKDDNERDAQLEKQIIQNNISINQGKGWGYKVRPDKNPSSILVLWGNETIPEYGDINLNNNKYFNLRNVFYTYHINPITIEHYKNVVKSDNNTIYMSEDSTLFCGKGNYQDRSILAEYNQDQNSTFRLLSDSEIEQISNPEILNSNDYNEIKTYYENLEKEFKYTDIKDEIINKYKEFSTNNQETINTINGLISKVQKIQNELEQTTRATITQDKLQELIDNTYSLGTDVVTAYTKQTITKQELVELIKQINTLGQVFDSIYTELNIQNSSNKQEINTIVQTIENKVNNNLDLDISELVELVNTCKDIQNKENTTYADYKFCTSLSNWIDEILTILIDQYIIDNPVTIKYTTRELTNEDVVATIETNAKIEVTNNSNSKEYVFKENGEFTFEYTIKEKPFKVAAIVNNIDKIAPRIDGVENEKLYTTSIRPIITDDNLLLVELIANGQVDSEFKSNTSISEEGIYKLTATDKAGNKTSVSFQIMEQTDEDYIITDEIIKNITTNTTQKEFEDKVNIKLDYEIYRNDQKLEEDAIIATGDILRTENGQEYTLIVAGDVNKDGIVNIRDIVQMRKYLLTRDNFDDISKLAADSNMDGKTISIKDLIRMRIITLTQVGQS